MVGFNAIRDLAVVSICCGSFTVATLGDTSALAVGDEVVAIGYALRIEGPATVTRGIVSAVRFSSGYDAEVIQTDAPINPGNSGGPLLSLDGNVMGINTFGYEETPGGRPVEGLNFAISVVTVSRLSGATFRSDSAQSPSHGRPSGHPHGQSGGRRNWGPLSGELPHDTTNSFIETEYANVSIADMVVEATFVNPYSASAASWDYGFILRATTFNPFLQFVVSGNRVGRC